MLTKLTRTDLHQRTCAASSLITVDMALRLEKLFGVSAELWLNLQQRLDVWNALRDTRLQEALTKIEPMTEGERRVWQRPRKYTFGYGKNPYYMGPE